MKKALISFTKISIFFIGWAILSGILDYSSNNPVIWRFFAELIPFLMMMIFTAVFLKIEKKEIKIPICNNFLKASFLGTIVGIIWLAIPSLILIKTNQLVITGKNSIPFIWIWILSAFINVIMQEFLVRGYIYQLLKSEYNLTIAITLSTVLFTLLHGGVFEAGFISVINVVTMCLFTTAIYESEGTLMAPIMAHAIWNIVGSIILGLVNLADDYPQIYNIETSSNIILSGGKIKLEGSILVTFINIVLIVLFVNRWRKCRSGKMGNLL